ncbi:hypothetical protein [Streptomyces sp. NPDC101455]|uniref:hypothetical protein n=1 Tax=Streptomyces sp. NPDC101455 TaxID=3366142 RepID=UPI0038209888
MTVEIHEEARLRTADLAREITMSLWPHDDALPWTYLRYDDGAMQSLPASLKAPVVTSAADVEADDLVVIFDQRRRTRRFDLLRYYTVREAVADRETVVARVTARTAKTITVAECQLPTGYWASCHLTAFGEPGGEVSHRTLRVNIDGRQIGRLGALDAIRRRIVAHADYPEWQAGYAAAGRLEKAREEQRLARQRAEQERQRPLRQAVERLGQIVGDDLVTWGGPWVAGAVVARALREPGRLRTYIAGLRFTEAICEDEYTAAREHLDLLGY